MGIWQYGRPDKWMEGVGRPLCLFQTLTQAPKLRPEEGAGREGLKCSDRVSDIDLSWLVGCRWT